MNDLASHIFNTANAMNRAKAAELSETPKGRWDMPSEHKAEGFSALGAPEPEFDTHCGDCDPCLGGRPDQCAIAPHIAKIPLRAEVRDMLKAADLYDEQADRCRNMAEACAVNAKGYNEEADRLEQLARDARAQSENLERMAGL